MEGNKDYTTLTLEALQAEEKKIKRKEFISALAVGFLVGIMVYGVATKGFGFLYIFIPLFLIVGIVRNSKNQKADLARVQAEINARSTGS